MTKEYDIVIIGAGMVGLLCANLLQDSGLRIAICEVEPLKKEMISDEYDLRVSAINKNSQILLEKVGCWQTIQHYRLGCYDTMDIWEQKGEYELKFFAADSAQDYLGYIVENSILRNVLLDGLSPDIDIISPIKFTDVIEGDMVQLLAENDVRLKSALVIGADGGNSWLRSAVGIDIKTYSYQQHAIVATVKTEYSHQNTAYQCFLSTGPLAFLPLDNEYLSSIVWSIDDIEAKRLFELDVVAFSKELSQVVESRLGKCELVSLKKMFPLRMRHANEYVKPGIALIGDALRTIHPLAGQGVNLGFHDAQVLAGIIKTAFNQHKDFASLYNLKKYQRARKSETLAMIVAMEFFKQAFASERLEAARGAIIKRLNNYTWVKNFFIEQASGL